MCALRGPVGLTVLRELRRAQSSCSRQTGKNTKHSTHCLGTDLSKAPSLSPAGVSPPQGRGSSGSWGPCIIAQEQTVGELAVSRLDAPDAQIGLGTGISLGARGTDLTAICITGSSGPRKVTVPAPPAGQQLLHGQEGSGELSIHPQLCSHHDSTGEKPACLLPGCAQNRTPQPTTRQRSGYQKQTAKAHLSLLKTTSFTARSW